MLSMSSEESLLLQSPFAVSLLVQRCSKSLRLEDVLVECTNYSNFFFTSKLNFSKLKRHLLQLIELNCLNLF